MQPLEYRMPTLSPTEKYALEQELNLFLQQLSDWLEMPMLVLGFTLASAVGH